jgi:hypothetical protein
VRLVLLVMIPGIDTLDVVEIRLSDGTKDANRCGILVELTKKRQFPNAN